MKEAPYTYRHEQTGELYGFIPDILDRLTRELGYDYKYFISFLRIYSRISWIRARLNRITSLLEVILKFPLLYISRQKPRLTRIHGYLGSKSQVPSTSS